MRRLFLIATIAAFGCGDDGATGPSPAERFAGTLSLVSENGLPLPLTLITPFDTLERRATTLEVESSGYLPRALFVDSVVEINVDGAVVANVTVRDTLIGFVSSDTVRFADTDNAIVYRFIMPDGAAPVRLQHDGTPFAEVWSRIRQ